MDKASYKIRLENWVQLIQEANSSGMTKREWCRKNGIPPREFYYWQKKARENALQQQERHPAVAEHTCVALSDPDAMAGPVFFELDVPGVQPDGSKPAAVEVHCNGFRVLVRDDATEETLSAVLSVIRHV